jgi:hypothetical protein
MNFICLECNGASEYESWNESTEQQYGGEIYPIEDDSERDVCYFCCPKCKAESIGSEIEKEE